MPKQHAPNQRENFLALTEFRHFWRECDGWISHGGAGFATFPAAIEYRWQGKTKLFHSNVTIISHSGPDDGQVDIDETDRVSIDDFHLRFEARWQMYSFDEHLGSLTVTGRSDKMGGPYSVAITPTLNRDQD